MRALDWERDPSPLGEIGYTALLRGPLGGVGLKLWVYRTEDRWYASVNGVECILSHRALKAKKAGSAVREAEALLCEVLTDWLGLFKEVKS